MAKKVLCIEVGLRFTRICELMGYKTTPVVYNCITFATPQGTFEDGYIRDKGTLGSIIRQQLVEHKIRTTETIFTVNSTKIANREVYIPYVKENKIKSIVELQASDYFPIDISEYNVSYYLLNKGDKGKGNDRKIKLLLLAAPNNLIQSYYNLATAAGLQIEAIDYIGNSYYQMAKRQLNQGVNISIHINENTSLINIIENENLLLQRIIPYGANDIIEKVLRHNVFNASTDEEAIALLSREKLINYQFEPQKEDDITYMVASESYDQALKETRAKEDVTESLKFLINNIIRVLDYFTAKNADKKIGYVYISGLGSKFQGLQQLFKNELGFDARRIDNLYVANFSNKINIEKSEQADYIACIGAGISPVDFGVKQKGALGIQKTDIKSWKNGFAFVSVVCIVFIGTMVFVRIQAATKQNKLEHEIDNLKSVETIYDEHQAVQSKYQNLNKMFEMTETKPDKLDIILKDLEEKLPSTLTVSNVTMDSEMLTFDIEAASTLTIAQMLINLEDIPYLSDYTINSCESSASESSSGVPTVTFKISANFTENEIGAVDEQTDNPDAAEGAEVTENPSDTAE